MNCRLARAALIGSLAATSLLTACGTIPANPSPWPSAASSPTQPMPPRSPATTDAPPPGPPAAPAPQVTAAPRSPTRPDGPDGPTRPDCTKKKCIALTFDDGPVPDTTTDVATALRKHRAKATFFMLGQNVAAHPAAVQQVAATGSEIGNHTWRHPSLTSLSSPDIEGELRRTNRIIARHTGTPPTLIRPPYGNTNRRLDHVAKKLDLAEIYWNVDTLDWKHPDTDRLIAYTLRHAARNKVILMHDIYPTTAAAVPKIITGLQARGYTLVTISELYPRLRPGGRYPAYQGRGLAHRRDYPEDIRQ
jgi:peptidoglycan/xylan/chitin deacetylase (PgdA/CDA1 family)